MSGVGRWMGGLSVLGGQTVDFVEVEGMGSNLKMVRTVPLHVPD